MTFFEEDAYIVDSGCIRGGGRILKLTQGKNQETFFGGEKGWGMNQLNGPSSITFDFVDGTAYIVDSGNHRILSVMRGKKYGQLFFGQGKGKELNQLHEPEAITFFDGFAYIVDAANNRILKVVPGRKEGTVFFGKGVGSSTDQLNRPQSISFFEGSAYIVDGGNSRVLMVTGSFLGWSSGVRLPYILFCNPQCKQTQTYYTYTYTYTYVYINIYLLYTYRRARDSRRPLFPCDCLRSVVFLVFAV